MSLSTDEFDFLEDEFSQELKDTEKTVEVKPAITRAKPEEQKEEEKSEEEQKEEAEEETQGEKVDEDKRESVIYAVKVTTKKEENALELIYDRIIKKKLEVYAVAFPHGLRGYLFIEALDRENAEEAVFNLPYVKGIIPKVLDYEELRSMLEPKATDVNIEKGDIVEIISDTLKKEKAKVVRIDKTKEEAVVSLLAAVVPIPVTVKLDNLRVIRRDELDE